MSTDEWYDCNRKRLRPGDLVLLLFYPMHGRSAEFYGDAPTGRRCPCGCRGVIKGPLMVAYEGELPPSRVWGPCETTRRGVEGPGPHGLVVFQSWIMKLEGEGDLSTDKQEIESCTGST